MMRPSLRWTHMLSGSKRTCVALAEELIPCPFDSVFVRINDFQQLSERPSVVAIIVGHTDFRFQPEFCFQAVFLNVNMDGFTWSAFIGVEEKGKTAVAKDCWLLRLYRTSGSRGFSNAARFRAFALAASL